MDALKVIETFFSGPVMYASQCVLGALGARVGAPRMTKPRSSLATRSLDPACVQVVETKVS